MADTLPWFLMQQANAVPPDQAQTAQGQIPPMLAAPQGAAPTQSPAPQPQVPPQAGPAAPVLPPRRPHALTAQAAPKGPLDAYVGQKPPADPMYWMQQAQGQAKQDQQKELDGLNDYIKQIQDKPQGINWTPVAAYLDSQIPGSKLTAAAEATAPMSEDQRDKMLFDLKSKLLAGRATLSKESLASLKSEQQMQQYREHQDELERHNRQMEGAQLANGQAGRVQVMQDTQTQHAADIFDRDPVIKTLTERKNQIGIDYHTLQAGGVITPQMSDEISKGIAVAFNGGKSSGLEETKKQEINTAMKDWAKIQQYVTGKHFDALTPENKQMLTSVLDRLNGAYGNVLASRGEQIRKGRKFTYNQAGNEVMDSKVNEYRSYAGQKLSGDDGKSSVGPHGPTVTQGGHTYNWNPSTGKYE